MDDAPGDTACRIGLTRYLSAIDAARRPVGEAGQEALGLAGDLGLLAPLDDKPLRQRRGVLGQDKTGGRAGVVI
jgi:hypothetical protein